MLVGCLEVPAEGEKEDAAQGRLALRVARGRRDRLTLPAEEDLIAGEAAVAEGARETGLFGGRALLQGCRAEKQTGANCACLQAQTRCPYPGRLQVG